MGEKYESYASDTFKEGAYHLKQGISLFMGGLSGKPEYTGNYHNPIAYGAERIRKGLLYLAVSPFVLIEDNIRRGAELLKEKYLSGRRRIKKVLLGRE